MHVVRQIKRQAVVGRSIPRTIDRWDVSMPFMPIPNIKYSAGKEDDLYYSVT